MSLPASSFVFLNVPQAGLPVFIRSPLCPSGARRSTRGSGRFARAIGVRFLSGALPVFAAPFRPASVRASFRLAAARTQPRDVSPIVHFSIASAYQPWVSLAALPPVHLATTEKTVPSSTTSSNMSLNPVRFALWTLRDKAAQRRLASR